MRLLITSILLSLTCFQMQPATCIAQSKATKIILLRHAEKDTVRTDPPLTARGKERAEQLRVLFSFPPPDLFYSTATTRTMHTLQPLAKQAGKEIQTYSATNQKAFADLLKSTTGKTIIVAGHSNTIPYLANLILGNDVYCDIPDNTFDRLYIITIKDGEASVVIQTY